MKRILLVLVLVVIAGVAGIVRSHSKASDFDHLVSRNATEQTREEIRQSYQLAPGASVDLSNINGSIKVETSDATTADVFVERTGSSREALGRRKVTIEADTNSLRIHGEKGDVGFFEGLFGTQPSEKLTLKLPRQISLHTKGVNGAVTVGEVDGALDIRGVNGRVQLAGTNSSAEFKGINGNISIGLKQLSSDGLTFGGINGNIELQVGQDVNADIDANGVNGNVATDLSNVVIDRGKHGRYSGKIGSGGSLISAKGINGNIRFTRGAWASTGEAESKDQSAAEKN